MNRLTVEGLQKELKELTKLTFKVQRTTAKEQMPPFYAPSYELILMHGKTERIYRGRKPGSLEAAKQICLDASLRYLFASNAGFDAAILAANSAYENTLKDTIY